MMIRKNVELDLLGTMDRVVFPHLFINISFFLVMKVCTNMESVLVGARDQVIPSRTLCWKHEDWVGRRETLAIYLSNSFHIAQSSYCLGKHF